MAVDAKTKERTRTLIEGLVKTFENADELYDEALCLAERGSVARALLLHQISLEECGKADMLCVAVFSSVRGEDIDMKRLTRAFSRHEAKNKANAYFLAKSEVEAHAHDNNDFATASEAFGKMQAQFHKDSNSLKNASLYVDFNRKFISPREAVTAENLADIRQRNADFMAMTHHKVSVIATWGDNLDAAADYYAQISSELGFDRIKELDHKDPEARREFAEGLLEKVAELAKISK
ncbi:AbiV family abortive infection protein [Paraburkholderia sartisoli]|uniref:Abortive infection protein, AbiV family n=1 Tax=Paraburkholderia sartisoli TaxID=83784 RepID=A0A1H4GQS4_9BURK|nr:AbiV family abortive infection protein [Paraburkholderia sartisoli]SEB11887.1 abortive infection protein, AbiV family [Paraburkholderia sartisoli]